MNSCEKEGRLIYIFSGLAEDQGENVEAGGRWDPLRGSGDPRRGKRANGQRDGSRFSGADS